MTKPRKKSKKAAAVLKTRVTPETSRSITEMQVAILRKELGKEAAANLRDGCLSEVREVLPTGIEVLDRHVLGIGGLPYGRIVEVAGKESSGKSSFGWQLLAAGQRDGALVAFGEAEQALDPAWIDQFGVDRSGVLSLNVDTLDAFTSGVDVLLEKGKFKKAIIVLDSVTNCLPQKAIDAYEDEKEIPAIMASYWSKWLPVVTKKLQARNVLLVLMNQIRSKPNVMFGPTEDTTGGRAIKFYASIRLSMWHGEFEKRGEVKIGQWSGFKAVKHKLSAPLRETNALLSFEGGGFNNDASTFEFAVSVGAAQRAKKVKNKDTGKEEVRPATTVEEARANLGWGPKGAEEPTR